jgi:hypothetical protein
MNFIKMISPLIPRSLINLRCNYDFSRLRIHRSRYWIGLIVLSQVIGNFLIHPNLAFPLGFRGTNVNRDHFSQKTPCLPAKPVRRHVFVHGSSWENRWRSLKSHSPSLLIEQLSGWLQGDFDNYPQVLRDVANQKFPGPSGGHEHMHCTFIPLSKATIQSLFPLQQNDSRRAVLAAYYLNGKPNQLFRLRLYTMIQEEQVLSSNSKASSIIVRMKLYNPIDSVREIIKMNIHQPLKWDQVLQGLQNGTKYETAFVELKGCDVLWSSQADLSRHTYLVDEGDSKEDPTLPPAAAAIHAVLEKPFVILPSTNYPGSSMIIKDELSLWENELWINDRGYNVDTMEQIYGNTQGIPYKVVRVTNIIGQNSSSQGIQRVPYPNNYHLMWTCGDHYRNRELYSEKMDDLLIN